MIRLVTMMALLAATPATAQTITCETQHDIRECWNEHGETVITEERSREYTYGHNNQGHAWTTWEHNGRTYTWPTPR
jgi:hypothetical protein